MVSTIILNLMAVLPLGQTINKQSKLSKHPVLLIVSFDGFRYDYATKTETPHLDTLKDEGVSVPYMEAQFPTKTFPNHHSIATGLFPEIHGVTDNSLFDPNFNKTLSGFNDDQEFWNFHPDILPIYVRFQVYLTSYGGYLKSTPNLCYQSQTWQFKNMF